MRYPFDRLEALILVDLGPQLRSGQPAGAPRLVAEQLGVDRRQVLRWREIGVTADQADVLAVRARLHPLEVWPELTDECTKPCARPACETRFVPTRSWQRFCSPTCRQREAVRVYRQTRYQTDPAYAEAQRAKSRAYYAECAATVCAKKRRARADRAAA